MTAEEQECELTGHAKSLKDRALLEAAILAVADHPQVGYYLRKHGLVQKKSGVLL